VPDASEAHLAELRAASPAAARARAVLRDGLTTFCTYLLVAPDTVQASWLA